MVKISGIIYCFIPKIALRGGKIILRQIRKEREFLERQLEKAKEERSILPQGTLRCTSSNGTDQYYIDGQYISTKNKAHVRKVAQREYDERIIPYMEKVISKLKETESIYEENILENIFETMCSARKKLVVPFVEPIDIKVKKFLEEKYEPLAFKEDDETEFYTLRNERVRSKSELIIADELCRYAIPYRYEKPLMLENWGNSVTFRPDFTVMNKRNGKIFILEHLGMMDNPDYVDKNMRKIDLYERNGILLGEKLLITHETSKAPLNRKVLDLYIETYLI